jgi:toxin-antitoxin system PIN domain toxin
MIRAIDTNILVYLAASDVPQHDKSRRAIEEFLSRSEENRIAVTDDVLLEFVHVVTDPRRLKSPLRMAEALDWAETFWSAQETAPILPSPMTFTRTLELLRAHGLSRKRLRDTMLAAVLEENGVSEILTSNVADFRIFPFLKPIDPTR